MSYPWPQSFETRLWFVQFYFFNDTNTLNTAFDWPSGRSLWWAFFSISLKPLTFSQIFMRQAMGSFYCYRGKNCSHGGSVRTGMLETPICMPIKVLIKSFAFSVILLTSGGWAGRSRVSFLLLSKTGIFFLPYILTVLSYKTAWNSNRKRSRIESQKCDSSPGSVLTCWPPVLYYKMEGSNLAFSYQTTVYWVSVSCQAWCKASWQKTCSVLISKRI